MSSVASILEIVSYLLIAIGFLWGLGKAVGAALAYISDEPAKGLFMVFLAPAWFLHAVFSEEEGWEKYKWPVYVLFAGVLLFFCQSAIGK